jgi:hypothetical protein
MQGVFRERRRERGESSASAHQTNPIGLLGL